MVGGTPRSTDGLRDRSPHGLQNGPPGGCGAGHWEDQPGVALSTTVHPSSPPQTLVLTILRKNVQRQAVTNATIFCLCHTCKKNQQYSRTVFVMYLEVFVKIFCVLYNVNYITKCIPLCPGRPASVHFCARYFSGYFVL